MSAARAFRLQLPRRLPSATPPHAPARPPSDRATHRPAPASAPSSQSPWDSLIRAMNSEAPTTSSKLPLSSVPSAPSAVASSSSAPLPAPTSPLYLLNIIAVAGSPSKSLGTHTSAANPTPAPSHPTSHPPLPRPYPQPAPPAYWQKPRRHGQQQESGGSRHQDRGAKNRSPNRWHSYWARSHDSHHSVTRSSIHLRRRTQV
jgi:hypothetical protein